MTVNLSALGGAGQQFLDDSGNVLTGGKLYSYVAGTTTPQTTYTSASGVTAHSNPIILNAAGRVATGEIWLTAGSNYKFVLYTSTDVLIASWDNITGINGTGITSNAINVEYDPSGVGAVPTNVQAKLRESVSVKDFGAVGDGVADDTAAIQAAVDATFYPVASNTGGGILFFPRGTYKITTAINLPNAQFHIYGEGTASVIYAVNCSAFSYTGQFTSISEMRDLYILGNNTAATEAFISNPSNVAFVIAKAHFTRLRIGSFPRCFNIPNAQLCVWEDCFFNGNANGSVFYIPITAIGQAANSNRVLRCQFTGSDVKTVDFDPSLFNARAANWVFDSCDFQQSGTTPPLTIQDVDWVIINCEFENSSAPCEIDIVNTDFQAQANNTVIENCVMVGSVTTAHIRIRRTGAIQIPYYTSVKNINVGGANLIEITSGRSTNILNCSGVVIDTGGEFTAQINGNQLLAIASFSGIGMKVKTALFTSGNGSPEGVVTAAVGSLYTRLNGGAGTTLYIKESGTGNTGWVAK